LRPTATSAEVYYPMINVLEITKRYVSIYGVVGELISTVRFVRDE